MGNQEASGKWTFQWIRMQTWGSWVLKGIGETMPSAEGMCRGGGEQGGTQNTNGDKSHVWNKASQYICLAEPCAWSTRSILSSYAFSLNVFSTVYINSLSLQCVHVLQGLTSSYKWHPHVCEWNFVLATGVRLGGCWASLSFQNRLCASREEDVPMCMCV